ncbi:patatin-like phospholipase family protein (plasmid) [Cupriavidus sp. P-10]|uniref:patatin-like phospholipase family protein n=1 Tax=Cupriavidus sp. P-10 TaxID=2027911 RepID=UPI001F3CEC42|nr:patatin-like phospholipase family protein [Cupriavidus sp. P-10]BDB28894.1 patatin-like phospholipase family protein [Cupriavidus sp. P-10]
MDVVGPTAVAMSFSGGGTRAAAFAFGALQGLDVIRAPADASLLDNVAFISSVSGGSITAAYYGLHGKSSLTTFRSVLLKDGEAGLRFSLLNPINLARLFAGGLNDREDLRTWLDEDVFKGATFADMFRRGKPIVWINATNVYYRVAFPFSQLAFDALCSDLSSFPVSEAVAASMAVPLFFAPIVLQKHPEACSAPLPSLDHAHAPGRSLLLGALANAVRGHRDTSKGKYIKLVDGGVTDNYGLATILQSRVLLGTPYGPMSENDAISVRRLLFIVVDAGQGPRGDWNQRQVGPSGIEVASAAIDAAMATNVRMSYDAFVPMMQQWRDDLVAYRCGMPHSLQQEIAARRPGWQCNDVEFFVTRISFEALDNDRAASLNELPTRLRLPERDVDRLIEAGRDAILGNPVIREFEREATAPR